MVEVRFPTSGLSSEYGDIEFSGVVSPVLFTVTLNAVQIISETYSPDSSGKIKVKDLGDMAMIYFANNDLSLSPGIDGQAVSLSVSLKEGSNAAVTKTVVIYRSDVYFSGSISVSQLKQIPLSRSNVKITGLGRKEFISFYGGVTVKAYVLFKSTTSDDALTVDIATIADDSKFHRLDVSPSAIAALVSKAESDLIYYNIYSSETALIRFYVDQKNYPNQTTFVFRNSFGAQESFTCIRPVITDSKWTRETGMIDSFNVSTRRSQEAKKTVNTGFVSDKLLNVIDDLLTSENVSIVDESGSLQKVVILDEKYSSTTSKDELNSVDITYRIARQKQVSRYSYLEKPGIFTSEYDNTFE